VLPSNLGVLVFLLEKQIGSEYNDYRKLTKDLNEEFDLELTEDDVIAYFASDIELQNYEYIIKHAT
jgi:hypothetical protein